MYGMNYREKVVLEKEDESPGYDGRWLLSSYDVTYTYPAGFPVNIAIADEFDLGYGIQMSCVGNFQGNQAQMNCLGNDFYLYVKNGVIFQSESGLIVGNIEERQVQMRLDSVAAMSPMLTGTVVIPASEGLEISLDITNVKSDEPKYVFSAMHRGSWYWSSWLM